MNKEMKIRIREKDGFIKEARVVTILTSEQTNKRYVVYTYDEIDQENDLVTLYASVIEKNGDTTQFLDISDEEWNLVKMLMKNEANK